ncbi:uncharacterized protein [Choristoneura fumiferana]|uniref:uncharacterized protein n=1 Tax=Choristoneura fumiferana TaxID=7141 RepID=UPI003D15C52A
MRFCIVLVVLIFVAVCRSASEGYDQPLLSAECPPNEYNPGPDCRVQQGGPEPSCGGRHASAHPNYICNCWCAPGLLRDLDSGKCVEKC